MWIEAWPWTNIVLWLWSSWVLANVGAFLLGVLLVKPTWPQFDGFRVRVPPWLREHFSEREIAAIIEHELGHRAHGHVWRNLLRVCCLCPVNHEERMRQEFEADDYVTDPGALSLVLRKLSPNPFDHARAQRLWERALQGQRDAGSPTRGMRE